MRRTITILATMLLMLVAARSGLAHRPEDGNPSGVTVIPNPTTSFAYYRELAGLDDFHVYQFEGQAGVFFHAGINIPQLDGLEDYGVSLALLGPGLPSLEPAGLPAQELVALAGVPDTLPGWAQAAGLESLNGVIVESTRSPDFYEPFTQTRYWGRQVIELELPEDGRYALVVWNEDRQPGKYVLDTGTQEVFSPADLLQFPIWWFNTRIFFEQGPALTAAAAAIVVLALAGLVTARRALATRSAQ